MAQKKSTSGIEQIGRRKFMKNSASTACGVGLAFMGLNLYSHQVEANSEFAIRPPGALNEKDFLSACVRCGQCVRDCPYDTLELAKLADEIAVGTPFFTPRKVACEMCEDIPCVKACPSGALDPELTNIDDSRMGIAVLIDTENCLNMQGLRCDVCYRVCPLIDEAITLEMHRNFRTGMHAIFEPRVDPDVCTGCGKCEHSCVLEEAAIKVLPPQIAKGKLGAHYRYGWKEKAKKGKSLIPEVLDLPDRMPSKDGGI